MLPYSPGITVERPEPVGDYKVPDGRWLAGIVGRLVELFTDGVPTVAMSLYLSPHSLAVADAVHVARRTGLPVNVTTVAEAVGSDVTNVVRACVEKDEFGAAAHVLSSYLEHDVCLAVSRLHARADHRRGRRHRRQARHHVRRPVPRARHGLLPGHRRRLVPRPRPAETDGGRAARTAG